MGEQDHGTGTKTALDQSKLSRTLVWSNHWPFHHNQSRRFFSRCPLQFRPLLVHHQVKAGSISPKLISAKVFPQPEIVQDKTLCLGILAVELPRGNYVPRCLSPPLPSYSCPYVWEYSYVWAMGMFQTLHQTIF